MIDQVYVDGELFLSVEVVAALYEVKPVWLEEVFELGLVHGEVVSGSTLRIAAVELDRVATIVRLHRGLGCDLQTIALALDDE